MVVLFYQYIENIYFFQFFAGGLHDWGILLVISLEFQEIKHQPFSMTQPNLKFKMRSLRHWTAQIYCAYTTATVCFLQPEEHFQRENALAKALSKDMVVFIGSVIVCGCFISTVRWKYSLFLWFFPWRDLRLRYFIG